MEIRRRENKEKREKEGLTVRERDGVKKKTAGDHLRNSPPSARTREDENPSRAESDNIDWDTDDELEIQNFPLTSCSRLANPGGEATAGDGEVNVIGLL
ncbi:hypothetical protein U1Q18_008133 [Sarracenia purpurea var. burkii]